MPRVKRLPTWSSFLIFHQVLLTLLLKQHSALSIYFTSKHHLWLPGPQLLPPHRSLFPLLSTLTHSPNCMRVKEIHVKLLCLFSLKIFQWFHLLMGYISNTLQRLWGPCLVWPLTPLALWLISSSLISELQPHWPSPSILQCHGPFSPTWML